MAAAAGKLTEAASKNQETIERSINKVAKAADEKTGSKYSEQIRRGGDGLRAGLNKLTRRP